jgi:hypothetical protein
MRCLRCAEHRSYRKHGTVCTYAEAARGACHQVPAGLLWMVPCCCTGYVLKAHLACLAQTRSQQRWLPAALRPRLQADCALTVQAATSAPLMN